MIRRRSVFLRVLAVVVVAGIVPLVLATVAIAYLVRADKEAALVDGAVAMADSRRQALDRRVALARAELRTAALAAAAGRLLEVPDLVSDPIIAVRCVAGGEEIVDAAVDAATSERLAAASTARPLTLVDGSRLVLHERIAGVDAWGLLDLAPLVQAPEGWRVGIDDERPEGLRTDALGGVVARRDAGGETATAVAPSVDDLFLTVRAPIAPAREAAYALTREVVLWSLLAVVPLVILAVLFARAVTRPVRMLARAVRDASEGRLSLPPLPDDEIGDLGGAVRAMRDRADDDARALRRAVEFSRSLAHLRSADAILTELGRALADAFPSMTWVVVPLDEVRAGAVPSDAGVSAGRLEDALDEAVRQAESSDSATGVTQQVIIQSDDLSLLPLVSKGRPFGVAVGRGEHDDAALKMAELLCRTATAAATNHELRQAALVNEKLALLGRLAASVAHEMNNPLAFVTANLRTLEASLDGQLRETATDAREGAERLARIVEDLSSISRGGSHRPRETLRAREIVELAAKIARARRPNVTIDVEVEREIEVHCDRGRIEQAVLNLVMNAADACGARGDGRVRVVVAGTSERALVDVRDNGPGIPDAVRANLFEAFFTTKRETGTGLGLFLSRSFVQGDGGDLVLASTGPEGTTFRLELPAAKASSLVPARPAESVAPSAPKKRMRVLVVDDEPAIVRGMTRWLGRRADVSGTTDPEEAIRLACEDEPDLILCDLNMPRMRGLDLVERIRAVSPALAGRVVIMTGSTSQRLPGRVLRKPVRPEAIEELFEHAS